MADQDQERQAAEAKAALHNPVLDKQAQGHTGSSAEAQGFSGDVGGGSTRSPEQMQGESQSGMESGDVGRGAFQGGQGASQQTFAQQGEADQQRYGLTSDQIGLNQQSYGQNVQQDTTGGQGSGEAHLAASGSSNMLGEGPAQSSSQPGSKTTGGPDFSKGLVDQNKG